LNGRFSLFSGGYRDVEGALASVLLFSWSGGTPMLFVVLLLVALWLLGIVTSTTLGGALHILLVIAIVFLLIRVIRGQPV
jgi:hypothetical protein